MGKLAIDRMAARQQRWRERSNKGAKLKTSHNVNSAVEVAVNEESEGNQNCAFVGLMDTRTRIIDLFTFFDIDSGYSGQ